MWAAGNAWNRTSYGKIVVLEYTPTIEFHFTGLRFLPWYLDDVGGGKRVESHKLWKNRDRRSIDPPPVLELITYSPEGYEIPPDLREAPFIIVHSSLWSDDRKVDRSLLENPYWSALQARERDADVAASSSSSSRQMSEPATAPHIVPFVADSGHFPDHPGSSSSVVTTRDSSTHCLVGSLVSMAHKFTDPDGTKRIMFAFPDLSVRCPGVYTLKFTLLDLGSTTGTITTSPTSVLHTFFSHPFTAYKPKEFPGKREPTALSRALAKQGIIEIHVRSSVAGSTKKLREG
ncbi:velvet factor-domain-containing protein [Phlyctochytrium arcticum]|nr:velvet factor-domain-containing protein [Phlyctochytrium arcticum]